MLGDLHCPMHNVARVTQEHPRGKKQNYTNYNFEKGIWEEICSTFHTLGGSQTCINYGMD
jgi:hypothetical protein